MFLAWTISRSVKNGSRSKEILEGAEEIVVVLTLSEEERAAGCDGEAVDMFEMSRP